MDDRRLWLNGINEVDLRAQGLTYASPAPDWDASLGNSECLGVHFPKLRRDGWKDVSHHVDESGFLHHAKFRKALRGGLALYQRVHGSYGERAVAGRGVYWSDYWLARSDEDKLAWAGAEWADTDCAGNLLAARNGHLLRVGVKGDRVKEQPVADLNPLPFRATLPGDPPRRVEPQPRA